MKLALPTALLLMLVSGCVATVNDSAICDGSETLREAHREALLKDGGDASVISGAALLEALQSACGVHR